MNRQKLEFFVLVLVGIISGGFLAVIALRYILPIIAPFAIAWLVAMAVRAPSKKISKRVHIPERLVRLLLSVLSVMLAFSAIFVGVWQGAAAVWRFLSDMGEGGFYEVISAIARVPIAERLGIPDELYARFEEAVSSMLSSALSFIASAVTSLVGFVPKALFFILITVIALIYFSLDLERINSFVRDILPAKVSSKISEIRVGFFVVCKKYVASYLLLTLITFALMLAGFLLVGVKHAFLIAVVVALLDVLPVIGVGTVLVPWSVYCFISGNATLGIGLAVLFVVNTVLRQIIEPKILGKSLDMHPILTLLLLYAGYALLGILGILLVPLAALAVGMILNRKSDSVSQ
ncbi:MAG: AI-2E family transporter [Clostridia bacterium]|nr:AI-2E family transporter [Clostridia bacterium]